MKYIKVVWVIGFLLLSAASFAADHPVMIVSGSNDPDVNGTYTYDGLSEGKASWVKGDYYLRWSVGIMGYSWNIEKPPELYYTNWSYGDIPEEINWMHQADALFPYIEPVVTAEPLPDTLFVSGTVDEFLNGRYVRGTNYDGYPRYAMGRYEIRQALYAMGSIWHIEELDVDPPYDPLYTYYVNFGAIGDVIAAVPERDWSLGPNAGSPASPPVVTGTALPDRYKVFGAGSDEVNGMYTRSRNAANGFLVYEKDSLFSLAGGYYGSMQVGYGIIKNDTDTYYSVITDSLLVPHDGWILELYGVPNPPFVTPYRFPWPMYLPSLTGGKE